VVKHAGAGGEWSGLNTRSHRIETRTGTTGTWRPKATVTDNTADVTTTTIAPRSARQVRLTVTAAEQGNPSGAVRIYEFEVYNGSPAPPAPAAPLVAYSGLDATGRAQRFEVGEYDVLRGNLGLIGNAAARSIDIAPGYRATICRHADLVECTDLAAGRHATLPAGFDLAISSLRVMPA
jgi:hypothetical protein